MRLRLSGRDDLHETCAAWSVWLIATSTIALFFVLQAVTLNYGTRINDLPYIRDYQVTTDVVRGCGLTRDQLVGI